MHKLAQEIAVGRPRTEDCGIAVPKSKSREQRHIQRSQFRLQQQQLAMNYKSRLNLKPPEVGGKGGYSETDRRLGKRQGNRGKYKAHGSVGRACTTSI